MALRPQEPAVVYALHHPGHRAVKIGACLASRQRIRSFTRHGWRLLADIATPTARDAEAIERNVLDALRPRVWDAGGLGIPGLPWHGIISGCRHCGAPPAGAVLRVLPHTPYLSPEQMPQGGRSETFDEREVSPERLVLALYFEEADQRARCYPDGPDEQDVFEARRRQVARAVRREDAERTVC